MKIALDAEAIAVLDQYLDHISKDWQGCDGFEFDGVIIPSRAFKVAVEALRTEIHKSRDNAPSSEAPTC